MMSPHRFWICLTAGLVLFCAAGLTPGRAQTAPPPAPEKSSPPASPPNNPPAAASAAGSGKTTDSLAAPTASGANRVEPPHAGRKRVATPARLHGWQATWHARWVKTWHAKAAQSETEARTAAKAKTTVKPNAATAKRQRPVSVAKRTPAASLIKRASARPIKAAKPTPSVRAVASRRALATAVQQKAVLGNSGKRPAKPAPARLAAPVVTIKATAPAASKPKVATPKVTTETPQAAPASSAPQTAAAAAPPAVSLPAPAVAARSADNAARPVAAPKSAANALLSQTKPDGLGGGNSSATGGASGLQNDPPNRPQDSPLAALNDSWKMLLYLVPMLLLTVGSLHLLRRFQERGGRLPAKFATGNGWPAQPRAPKAPARPGLWSALVGGFHLNNARQRGGSIRLVESIPVGGANLHLIEVRGRILLIGATNTGVSLLTEFQEPQGLENGDFRALLQAAALDMDALDLSQPELPAVNMLGALEDTLRETGEAVTRRARRLRTVREEENECV